MKKHIASLGTLLMTAALLAGCGNSGEKPKINDTPVNTNGIVYSNLADTESQNEVAEILESHGVTKEQTQALISWADDYNSRVSSGTPAEGFQPLGDVGADYSGFIVDGREAADGMFEPEANCRLTSYLLMKNLIQTNGKQADNDTVLVFDMEAVDSCRQFALSEEERNNYVSLFSRVPLNGADTMEKHIELIQNTWKDRDIKIEGDGISLITVYLHMPFDDVRFVGHTGVLVETDDGLLFIEKYGPQLPFQATRFHDRNELKEYLLNRADLYGDETELAPIVMENDRVI